MGGLGSTDVPGFGRNRGPMLVRLQRSGTPDEGIYWCKVNDSTDTNQTVYVGLYNSGGGIFSLTYQNGHTINCFAPSQVRL